MPGAVSAFLSGARVDSYDPITSAEGWEISDGDVRFDGRLIAHSNRWDRGHWVEIRRTASHVEGYAFVIQLKFSPGGYYSAGIVDDDYPKNYGLGLTLTSDSRVMESRWFRNDRPPFELMGNYPLASGVWHTMLFAVGKDGRFRIMMIDPQNPKRFALWDETHIEYTNGQWQLGFMDGWGTLELKDFMVIQFEDFVKVKR